MSYYWIKLYQEILDDPKMATLPDRLWRRVIEIFLCAGRIYNNGELPDTPQIAWMLRVPTDELALDLQQMVSIGIVEQTEKGWRVINFSKRQDAVDQAGRKRQQRERTHKEEYYGNEDVTDVSRSVTQIRSDQIRSDTDTDAESPSPFSHLSAFVANTLHVPEFTPNPISWSNAIDALSEVGATEEDIITAVHELDGKYSIIGAQSIVNAVRNVVGKRKRRGDRIPSKLHDAALEVL